jgi:uncharacterized protein
MKPRRRTIRRAFVGSAIAFVTLVAALYLAIYLLQDRFIYYPQPLRDGPPPEASSGLPIEEAWLTSADGLRLNAWFVPPPGGAVSDAPAVLWLHGNGGNIRGVLPPVRELRQATGASFLLVDYPGYGRSEGEPSEEGLVGAAAAGIEYLARRTGRSPERVVCYGHSLGGGVAIQLARRTPCAGLILESTFTSMADMAELRLPWVPFVGAILRTRFESRETIAAITAPVLVLHGTADHVIPFGQGQALFAAAGTGDRTFVALDGKDHADGYTAGAAWRDPIAQFIRRVATAAQP